MVTGEKTRKRAKQRHIPEVEEERDDELDSLIDERAEIVAERVKLTGKEVDINKQIEDYMIANKLKEYTHNGYRAGFTDGEPVFKVSKIKEPKPEKAAS